MEKPADISSSALALEILAGSEILDYAKKNAITITIQGSLQEGVEKRIVYGVVIRPDVVDFHGDKMTPEEVEKSAHHWMATRGDIFIQHRGKAFALPLESYIAPSDITLENGAQIIKGDWVMAVKVIDDTTWDRVRNGDITGFSVGGFGEFSLIESEPT